MLNISRRIKLAYYYYIFIFLYFLLALSSLLIITYGAKTESIAMKNDMVIFYWLSRRFFVIQAGNLMPSWAGMLACIFGIFISKAKDQNTLKSILHTLTKILVFNFFALITVIITTYLFESVFIKVTENYTSNIFIHSLQMSAAMYLFLCFWSLLGNGLRLTFQNRIVACLLGVLIQPLEMFIIEAYKPIIERYLPTALSRELIVKNFPFWQNGSWSSLPNVNVYANTSMIVDNNYRFIEHNNLWVAVFLIWYISIVYIRPLMSTIFINDNSYSKGDYDLDN